ncbi:MAG: response regulator transcription factor [Deltaproteobacteria bacterium]|jgi:two-component system phosphate regulon response regulator PhoB|nr:response regulator transcription factor [Deltaproteobacteria bacterium]
MGRQKILLIEDEADIRELLAFNLQKEGFATLEAGDGRVGLEMASRHAPVLILLDLMLPGMDGLTVCRELERNPATASIPLIMLTAKGEEMDRVVGLELGADDYVVKPFSVRELILRIRNILKRQAQAAGSAGLSLHGVTVNQSAHKASVNGENVDLTATEFRLLGTLMRHAGQVLTREQLLNGVWGYQFEGYARTVDTHVRRLRSKLGAAAEVVETVRGVGYRFR